MEEKKYSKKIKKIIINKKNNYMATQCSTVHHTLF